MKILKMIWRRVTIKDTSQKGFNMIPPDKNRGREIWDSLDSGLGQKKYADAVSYV